MIKKLVCASVGMVAWTVIAAKGGRPRTDLIASVEFAPFSDVQQKIVDFGNTINNPMVSMMAVPTLQNVLTEKFGNFRSDASMKFLFYADVEALGKALEADSNKGFGNALEPVLVYPCAEGAAKFLENHPEAQKAADGLIKLEDGNVVLFAADDSVCVFARKAAVAKRALKSALAAAKHASKPAPAARKKSPFVRVDLKKDGLAVFAELHQKLLDMQEQATKGVCAEDATLTTICEIQRTMGKRQNAVLRNLAHTTFILDLDETGLIFRGSLKLKSDGPVSPAAGFTLPANALADVPAGAPLFCAMNPSLSMEFRNEEEFRNIVRSIGQFVNVLSSCIKKEAPGYAETSDGVEKAIADVLAAAAYPAPTDWNMLSLAFGPQQEPYMVCAGECANAVRSYEAGVRFYAALAEVLGKKWPGIVSANGATLTVDWSKLIDVVAAETKGSQASVDKAKATVAKVLGGTASEITTVLPSQTSYRVLACTKGFTPPAASSGEQRLAAVLPEVVAKRPSGVFYLSLYSLIRDHVMPIAIKCAPAEKGEEVRSVVALLPEAAGNGAIAGAHWSKKDGSSSFLLRITKDEIRNIGMAVNAIIAAQAQATE